MISQDGREAAMSPGDFAVYDSIRPYTLRSDDDSQKIMLKLRDDPLRAMVRDTDKLTATTVSGPAVTGHLVIKMIRTLRDEVDSPAPASAAAVASDVVNVLVEEVATELGMSVGHWRRLFKSEPRSPSQHLWNRRLEACSRELLDPRRGRAALVEIAFAWGFNDATLFSRAFRQRFLASPREWRRHGVVSA